MVTQLQPLLMSNEAQFWKNQQHEKISGWGGIRSSFSSENSLRNYTGGAEFYAHAFLRTRRYTPDFFCGSFFYIFFVSVFDILPCLYLVALLSPAGNRLTSMRIAVWRFLVLRDFPIRCPGSGVVLDWIDSWSLPSFLLFLLTRIPTHKKYRILCYPLKTNSGWLPIRCAYFILILMPFFSINCVRNLYPISE